MRAQSTSSHKISARTPPGRLPQLFGPGVHRGANAGPVHLVAEDLGPHAPRLDLVGAQVAMGVDPGPAQVLGLTAARRRLQAGGGVAELLVRGPLVEEF